MEQDIIQSLQKQIDSMFDLLKQHQAEIVKLKVELLLLTVSSQEGAK